MVCLICCSNQAAFRCWTSGTGVVGKKEYAIGAPQAPPGSTSSSLMQATWADGDSWPIPAPKKYPNRNKVKNTALDWKPVTSSKEKHAVAALVEVSQRGRVLMMVKFKSDTTENHQIFQMVVHPTWPAATISKTKKFMQDLYNEYCDGKITLEEMKEKKTRLIADIGGELPAVMKRPAAKEEETAKPEGNKRRKTRGGVKRRKKRVNGPTNSTATDGDGPTDRNAVTDVDGASDGSTLKIATAGADGDDSVGSDGARDDSQVSTLKDNRGRLFAIGVAGPTEDWVGTVMAPVMTDGDGPTDGNAVTDGDGASDGSE